MRAAPDGPVVTWDETYDGSTKVYAARFKDSAFQLLGPAIATNASPWPSIAMAIPTFSIECQQGSESIVTMAAPKRRTV
ncbi:MAG TPA: hypothetical protein VHW01_19450 [Polyangiaceae bacterium]|nr:hypothetical protein [Polyangiaceae bacterium]